MQWKHALAASAAALISFSQAPAATVIDPANDFLPTYAFDHDPDLDVTSFSVGFNSVTSEFLLGAVLNGPIDFGDTNGLYVIGVNTGTGVAAPFASIGAPNVKFNQVVIVNKDGSGLVSGPSGGALGAGALTLVGNLFTVRVPLSLLPSTGYTAEQYGFNLWPRYGLGSNDQISDFAPNNATLSLSVVPEPASWAMMMMGFGLSAAMLRRKRQQRNVIV